MEATGRYHRSAEYQREYRKRPEVGERLRERDRKNKDRKRELLHKRYPMWLYGLTREEYDRKRSGPCDLCGKKKKRMVIDHDHVTKRIRGTLCVTCNVAIGQLGDNEEGISRVLEYLRGTK